MKQSFRTCLFHIRRFRPCLVPFPGLLLPMTEMGLGLGLAVFLLILASTSTILTSTKYLRHRPLGAAELRTREATIALPVHEPGEHTLIVQL